MRALRLLALLLLATPGLAQEPVPDTTAPWRYFPLEVGNEWQYRFVGEYGDFLERRSIVGDLVLGEETYFQYRVEKFNPSGQPIGSIETHAIRFDTTTASLVASGGFPDYLTSCPLDAPFGAELTDCPNVGFCTEVVWTSGGVEAVGIGGDLLATVVKGYDEGGCESAGSYGAGVGLVRWGTLGGMLGLEYARVGGVEYGAPVVVAAEPGPASSTLALAAAPNPVGDALALTLDLPAAGPVIVEAFDALGRRVARHEAALGAGRQAFRLDAARWVPGLYVVRVTATDGTGAARVVRR